MADADSILNSTKKMVGLDLEESEFDLDIITHINSVFFTLTQIGIGPQQGFMIEGSEEGWVDFFGEDKINGVKSYMYLKVRLLFDPPSSSFVLEAMNKQAEELEWRLHVHMEGVRHPWVDPALTISSLTTE